MKRWLIIAFFVVVALDSAQAQNYHIRGSWHQEWTVIQGDSVPHVHLLPVYVYSKGINQRKYWLLVNAVKKVYPLAQTAKDKMANMEYELASLPTEKAQKEYVDKIYDEIKEEYTPVLKKMTRTQGRVLLKLIDRETEFTAYNILRDFRGRFIAGFWQGVSRVFGQNLKSEYGEAKEDAIIEQIVIYYEAGLL